jgi:hypothetical protein
VPENFPGKIDLANRGSWTLSLCQTIRVLGRDRNPLRASFVQPMHGLFMQGPGRFAAISHARRLGGRVKFAGVGIILREGPGHEIDDRDCHRSTTGVLHHCHQRGLRRRRAKCRRPELLIQRSGKCFARRALHCDPPTMRRKIFRQLLRRQALVDDVIFVSPAFIVRHPGEGRDP